MKQGNKSYLVGIETKKDSAVANTPPVEVTVMNDAAVVHFRPLVNRNHTSNMQRTYSSDVCFFATGKNTTHRHRWGVYLKDTLKLSTRANIGTGTLERVSSYAKLPGNWIAY